VDGFQDGEHRPGLFSPGFEAVELEKATWQARIRQLANDAARKQILRETLGEPKFTDRVWAHDMIARPKVTRHYRVDKLWPANGRIILAAQYKAGKTTLVGNLVRSLVDGTPFLSAFPVIPVNGNVALFDTEMSEDMIQSWLSAQGIENAYKIAVFPMRGQVSTFDITDEAYRKHWTQQLKDDNIQTLILDCLGPVMGTSGLDESPNKEVGQFLLAFEQMLSEAGIAEALIVHHMGHTGERARGASRLRDWPDAEWQLIREGQEDDGTAAPDARRYFRAYGRDVDVKEQLLDYEPNMRWLSVGGHGDRKQVRAHRLTDQIIAYVKANPGKTAKTIRESVSGRYTTIIDALRQLTEAGTLHTREVRRGNNHVAVYFHENDELAFPPCQEEDE